MNPISIALGLAREFAPGLVRRLAGERAGEVAEMVLNMGRTLTGHQDPEAIAAELRRNTELQHQFRMQAQELDVRLTEAYLEDKQSARERDIALQQRGGNRRGDILAFTAIGGLIACIVLVFIAPVPEGPARDIILLLSGALIAIVKEVYSFEFGSSRGSKDKTAQLLLDRAEARERNAAIAASAAPLVAESRITEPPIGS